MVTLKIVQKLVFLLKHNPIIKFVLESFSCHWLFYIYFPLTFWHLLLPLTKFGEFIFSSLIIVWWMRVSSFLVLVESIFLFEFFLQNFYLLKIQSSFGNLSFVDYQFTISCLDVLFYCQRHILKSFKHKIHCFSSLSMLLIMSLWDKETRKTLSYEFSINMDQPKRFLNAMPIHEFDLNDNVFELSIEMK